MDINKAFEEFLDKKVNLNEGRVKRMKDAIRVLPDFVKGIDTYKDIYLAAIVQGSARQKTIIKPPTEDCAFDVDLGLLVKEKTGWEAKDYIANLADGFRSSDRYKDITDTNGKTRCVTIDYEGDFHVDLVPIVVTAEGHLYVCNKKTNQFEQTDGEGYAKWFEGQNAIANGHLVHVVRLLKHLRDFNEDFATKSIILTTIAGFVVRQGGAYGTLPQAFATITANMDAVLSKFEEPPSIQNPAMPGETFNRHWKNDKEGYKLLKTAIGNYASISRSAITSATPASEWKKIFGDSFGASLATASATIPGLVSPTFAPSSYTPPASFHPQRTYGTHY